MIRLRFLVLILLAIVIGGCSHSMALKKNQDTIDVSEKSIALFSVKVVNQNDEGSPVRLKLAYIDNVAAPFRPASALKKEEAGYSEYWMSAALKPGVNEFTKMLGGWPNALITALCKIPLNLKVDIKPNSVAYLGHLDVVLRKKKNDDEKSAAAVVYPYTVGTSAAGYFTSTFDVTVKDRFDEDMKVFLSEYPALQKVQVMKNIFPQWVRPEKRGDN